MRKIDIKTINRQSGFEIHDILREGASSVLDPLKVSAVLFDMQNTINQLIDEVDSVKQLGTKALKQARKRRKKV